MHDARMRCAMLGCDARCQDAMRDARMRCAMLRSILASHPGIASSLQRDARNIRKCYAKIFV